MGTASSRTIQVRQATVTQSSNERSSYPPPSPPLYKLDDIKIPISFYNRERLFEDDGFNWSEIVKKDDDVDGSDTAVNRRTIGQIRRAGLSTDTRHIMKQQPPSVKRPIRSITLHGRSKMPQLPRQRSFTPHRSPNHSRKSTPTGIYAGIKVDFDDIDQHAKVATKVHRQSYESLMNYLLEPIRSSTLSDIKTARVLLVWLAHQPRKVSRKRLDTSTPEGLLHMVANGTENFATAYIILCRQAGLPCVLIEGVSKSFTYTPTDGVTPEMDDKWTSVYCEGSWQFVHPDIVCKSIGFKSKCVFSIFLDDFFMPTPEHFIYTFFPHDESWQLLSDSLFVNSVEAFLKLPCIFPCFFKLGLNVHKETRAILSTKHGKCELSFNCDHSYQSKFCLTGKLICIDSADLPVRGSATATYLQACVLCSRQNNRFAVEIRLPRPGRYKLELFGCFTTQPRIRLCNFLVECNETLENVTYLPFRTDDMMWGPAFICDEAGLMVPSQMAGIIDVPIESSKKRLGIASCALKFQTVNFRFLLHIERTKQVEFFAHLRRTKLNNPVEIVRKISLKGPKLSAQKTPNDDNGEDSFYTDFIKCERKEDGQVFQINVTLPHVGEFGLMITKRNYHVNKRKQKIFTDKEKAVCAYFLRAKVEPFSDNVHVKLARENMVALVYTYDRNLLMDAIDKFRRLNLSLIDVDVCNAEKWSEYLKLKADLNDSIHRRNINFIDNTLRSVIDYRYKAILHSKISRVFHLRHKLIETKSLQNYEPYLKQAANELAKLDLPTRPVHITMAAVLLMFGELEKKIEDWSYIKKQLTGENPVVDPPLLRKIQYISEICPTKNDSKKIITLLQQHNLAEIQDENPWAVYFHLWAVKVMSVLEDTYPNDIGDFPDNLDLSEFSVRTSNQTEEMGNCSSKNIEGHEFHQKTNVSQQTGSTQKRARCSDRMAFNTVYDNKASVLESGNISEASMHEHSEPGISNQVESQNGSLLWSLERANEYRDGSLKLFRHRAEVGIQTDMD